MNDIAQLRAEMDAIRRDVDDIRRAQPKSTARRWAASLAAGFFCVMAAAQLRTPVAAAPTKVTAPFAVVNDAGQVIFLVHQKVDGPSVEVHAGSQKVLQMGMSDSGNPAFRVSTLAGLPGAALGVSQESGVLQVFNGITSMPVAWVVGTGAHGAPMVAVSRGEGIPHGALTLGANGGVLQLADTAAMIKAEGGILDSGAGVFRVRGKVFQYISGGGMRLPGW